MKIQYFLIFLIFFKSINCANILVLLQSGCYSHHLMYDKLMEGLLEKGHNLTIFTSFFKDYKNHENVTQHVFTNTADIVNNGTNMMIYKLKRLTMAEILLQNELTTHVNAEEDQFEHPEIQKIIKNKENYKFDLLIIECFICSMVHFAELYDVPIVFLMATDVTPLIHNILGNDINPFVYSDIIYGFTYGKLSFTEMMFSATSYLIFSTFGKLIVGRSADKVASKYMKDVKISGW